jgi:hypothetical protein
MSSADSGVSGTQLLCMSSIVYEAGRSQYSIPSQQPYSSGHLISHRDLECGSTVGGYPEGGKGGYVFRRTSKLWIHAVSNRPSEMSKFRQQDPIAGGRLAPATGNAFPLAPHHPANMQGELGEDKLS